MATMRLYTAADLEAMGTEAPYILICGRLVREEMGSGRRASRIAVLVATYLNNHVLPRRLGEVYGADGSFILEHDPDTVLVPDAAFVRADRLPPGDDTHFVPVAPDLAVEVLSPSNRQVEMQRKVDLYLRAGTRLVWIVDAENKCVIVHEPGAAPRTLAAHAALDGGEVLPGFSLPLAELFAG